MEDLRVHLFADDEAAHDNEAIDRLYAEFSNEFDGVATALAKRYGSPFRTGEEDDEDIPLNGVFRFAIWLIGDMQLFVAVAHEDRECPILLLMGTAGRNVA